MNPLNGEPDDDRLAALLVDFETQLAAGNRSTASPDDQLPAASEISHERLEGAKECLVLLEEIWPHAQPLDDELPQAIGRFRIVRELGRGGFGIVYLALDERLGREVALKVQRPEAIISAPLRDRFLREAKTAARLSHPCIAGVHEVGEAGLRIWIAYEYVAGNSLAAWLRANPASTTPRAAAAFLASLAEAVEFAHHCGVLHRDLKPSNVLLEWTRQSAGMRSDLGDCNPKLIDFGLAKLEESQRLETRSGALIGTPPYMAPEQVAGKVRQIGPATDVYGLGTILYELLTGRAVFGGVSDVQTLRQVVEDEPIRPRKFRPGLPADLEAICLKCLEKSPHKRYPTAAALTADLGRFLAGQPTEARPARTVERLLKWARRRPALAALLGVSAAAVIGIVTLTAIYVSRLRAANQAAEESRVAAVISAESSHRQEQAVSQFLYASQMKLAYQAIDQGEIEQATSILDRYNPSGPSADPRGFEWYHLKRRLHSERLTLTGHQGEVYTVTFSPDGRQVVSGGQDGTIRFWDAESGTELKTVAAHQSCVNAVVYAPGGAILATASCDRTIKLWDATTLTSLGTLDGHLNEVHCLAFCPTNPNQLAAAGHEPLVRIWDLETREIARTFNISGDVHGLAWRADGKTLFMAGGGPGNDDPHHGITHVWHIEEQRDESYPWGTYSVATSSDDDVCWGFLDATIHGRAHGNLQPLVLPGHAGHVNAVAFSVSGDRFASAGADGTIRIWDTAKNVCTQVFTGHTARVQSLALSPRDSTLASASFDGTIKLWNNGRADQTLRTAESCVVNSNSRGSVAVSADFCYWAVQSKLGEARVERLDDGSLVGSLPLTSPPKRLQFLPDRRILFGVSAGTDHTVDEWDLDDRQSTRTHRLPDSRLHDVALWGRYLVLEHDDATSLTDTSSGERWQRLARQRTVGSTYIQQSELMFSPDGASLAIGREHNLEPNWIIAAPDGRSPREIAPESSAGWRAISNGAKLVAKQVGRYSIALTDLQSGTPLVTLRHPDPVSVVCFSPDAKTLATGCGDQTVCLWHVASGQEIVRLVTRPGDFVNIQFSADGRRLAAVSRTDIKGEDIDYTYPDGTRVYHSEKSTAIVTIWSGIDSL